MIRSICLCLTLLVGPIAFCQTYEDRAFKNQQRLSKRGMLVLAAWGGANLISGLTVRSLSAGKTMYLHEMNAGWGIINASLGIAGYVKAKNDSPHPVSSTLNQYHKTEKVLLFNAGLDLAYIASGFWLIERGKHASNSAQLDGYGRSLILQGIGLAAFDIGFFLVNKRERLKLNNSTSSHLYPHISPTQIGLTYVF